MKRRDFIALSAAASAANAVGAETGEAPPLSFGLITDVQYADADAQGERHYRESVPKLRDAVADLAKEKLPFTLHLGDLIDRDAASFAAVLPLLEGLGHPVRHLLGNHDFDVVDAEKPGVSKRMGMSADHYSFTASGVRFLMLDTNDLSTYKHAADSEATAEAKRMMKSLADSGAKNAKPWNGGVSPDQLEWMKRELAAADEAKQPVIVCSHHPLLPEEGHQAWNNREVLALLRGQRHVRACFCGHNHAGNEVMDDGVPHITFKSLLHEPGVTAYSVVRLHRDRLAIEGRGREKSRDIPLRPM